MVRRRSGRATRGARRGGAPDRRALVTGASSGIGAAFARALAGRGERLVLVARRRDRLAALAEELGGDEAAVVVPADLAQAAAPAELVARLAELGIEVDCLINNAGVGLSGPFLKQAGERLDSMIALNVGAVVGMTRAFLPGMVERRRGRLVNVVSMSAFQPVPYLAVYAATKAFALAFTEGLAGELAGSGVRLQALCPGNVLTEFQQVAGTEEAPFTRTPATRVEDVVAASLRGLDQGQLVVVPGLMNRVTVAAQGLLPRSLVRNLAGELFRPR